MSDELPTWAKVGFFFIVGGAFLFVISTCSHIANYPGALSPGG